MDMLAVLEEKIKLLVGHVKKLQAEIEVLQGNRDLLSSKADNLALENAKLIEENAILVAEAKEARSFHAKGNKELDVLNKERELTKVAVDDLIKSLDVLISIEGQHSNEA